MTNTDWNKKLQTKVNQIAKLIDYGLPCLAKGHYPGQMHAGHVLARGGNHTIRFNLHNIHRQSAESNYTQKDDLLLQAGLEKEYGTQYLEFVQNLKRTGVLKLFPHEYKEIYKKACEIENMIRNKVHQPISPEYRIKLRNDINTCLGIYPEEFCIFPPLTLNK